MVGAGRGGSANPGRTVELLHAPLKSTPVLGSTPDRLNQIS